MKGTLMFKNSTIYPPQYVRLRIFCQKNKFITYFFIGGFSGFVDLLLLILFTETLHIWYIYSSLLSFGIVSVIGFYLNKYITFADVESKHFVQYFKYFFVILIGLMINTFTLYILTDHFGLWYVLSRIVAALVALVWNFSASSKLVFIK